MCEITYFCLHKVICHQNKYKPLVFEVLVTCNDGKRNYAIDRLKEFHDIKNIQQRKNQNEISAKVESNDKHYVMTNIVQRIQDMDGISDVSIPPL